MNCDEETRDELRVRKDRTDVLRYKTEHVVGTTLDLIKNRLTVSDVLVFPGRSSRVSAPM